MTDKQKVSNESPLFWYRPRSDGGYEGPLHNGQIEDVRKASGAWVPLFAGAAPVSAEPVSQYFSRVDGCQAPKATDTQCICWHDKGTGPYPDARVGDIYNGVTLTWQAKQTAPVAAQVQPQSSRPGAAPRNSEILDLAISQGMTADEGVYCGSAATILCFAGALTHSTKPDQAQQVDRSTEMQGTPVDKLLDLQGHASVIFSKAVAWADARVEAALIQEQGKPHGQACDEAAQAHYELVKALRNLQAAQQPVSGADGLDERAEFEKAWTSFPGRKTPIRFDDGEYQYPAANTAWKFWQARAALAQQDADPLQGAADWLVKDCGVSDSVELASRLSIGYNRASRLLDAARKEQE